MADLPFTVLTLFIGIDMLVGITGIALSTKKIYGSPMITVFAGIMMFALIALTAKVDVGYADAPPSNTTQTGGTITCTTTSSTTCTVNSILKTFSYKNSTNQLTNRPDPIPEAFSMNQENVWVFLMIMGIMWIFMGIVVQVKMIE